MVQIYYNEELNDIMFETEALDEWKQLANSLGMENQLAFVSSSASPIPYPHVNRSMDVIFSTLCPMRVNFKEYKQTPVPLEVLKQISLSVNDKHFQRIEIWFDDKAPDPFVIGVTEKKYVYDRNYKSLMSTDGNRMLFDSEEEAKSYANLIDFDFYGTSTTNTERYLIARWGDEIKSLPELKKAASEKLIEKYGAELRNRIESSTQALKKLTDNVVLYLNAEISESELRGER